MTHMMAGLVYLVSMIVLSVAFAFGYSVCKNPFVSNRIFLKKFAFRTAKLWGFLLIIVLFVHFFSK